ncbi:MAG: TatD family hydrolase [Bdellovibrionales bacterium]
MSSFPVSWIDVHAHLEMLETNPEETLKLAEASGVNHMITIGTHPEDNKKVLELAKKYFPRVVCTLGIHPHESKHYTDDVEESMRQELSLPHVVGVGEIGLDYYYDHSDRTVQKEVFDRQMKLAQEFGLPVEIHTRDAEADTIEILARYKGTVKGLIHCFTGTQWLADEALKLGYNISFSGILTFKTAQNLRDTLKTVPLDRIHVETDAPFLAPVPHRGKKNTPALLVHTAQLVAETKGVELEELRQQIHKNAHTLFTKWDELSL